jgi:CRISPR/Cas system-associated exonuclease Cas4 (RecB family)
MAKNLLKEIMIKDQSKEKVDIVKLNFDAGLIEKIESGYTINNTPKHQQKKTFAPSTLTWNHGECARYWYLAFNGAEFEDNADAYGVANRTSGTLSHNRIQDAMLNAGVAKEFINDKNEKTTEFKIISQDPPIFGYGDAIINIDGEEVVGEIKTMPNEGFEYRKTHKKPKAAHVMQLLIYMKILKKRRGVLIYENKNNHELLTFPIEVNDQFIRWVDQTFDWLREVRSAWTKKTIPQKNYRSNSKICKQCPIQKACASAETGEIKIRPLELLENEDM